MSSNEASLGKARSVSSSFKESLSPLLNRRQKHYRKKKVTPKSFTPEERRRYYNSKRRSLRPRNFKESLSPESSYSSRNNSDPIVEVLTEGNFESSVCPVLNPDEIICFDFCVRVLRVQKITCGRNKGTPLISVFIEILNNFPEIIGDLSRRNSLIILQYLRLFNPPLDKPPLKYGISIDTVILYSQKLFSSYIKIPDGEGCELNSVLSGFLFNFLNQIAYEETSVDRKIGFGLGSKILLHYIEAKDKTNTYNNSNDFKQVLVSSAIEEIALKVLLENGEAVVCCIHSPYAGDILLRNGKTVEVKATVDTYKAQDKFKASMKKSIRSNVELSLGVYGGDQATCTVVAGKIHGCFRTFKLDQTSGEVSTGPTSKSCEITDFFNSTLQPAFVDAFRLSGITNPLLTTCPDLKDLLQTDNNTQNYINFGSVVRGTGLGGASAPRSFTREQYKPPSSGRRGASSHKSSPGGGASAPRSYPTKKNSEQKKMWTRREPIANDSKFTGVIKKIIRKEGKYGSHRFGFITSDKRDYYFNLKDYDDFEEGDKVLFVIITRENGKVEAINVKKKPGTGFVKKTKKKKGRKKSSSKKKKQKN